MAKFNMKGKNRGKMTKIAFEKKRLCKAIIGKPLLIKKFQAIIVFITKYCLVFSSSLALSILGNCSFFNNFFSNYKSYINREMLYTLIVECSLMKLTEFKFLYL